MVYLLSIIYYLLSFGCPLAVCDVNPVVTVVPRRGRRNTGGDFGESRVAEGFTRSILAAAYPPHQIPARYAG